MTLIVKKTAAALLALVCCISMLASCGEDEMPSRLDGLYTASGEDTSGDGTSSATSSTKADDTEYSTPAYVAGSYEMESTSKYEEYIYSDDTIVAYVQSGQTYNYSIDLTVNNDGSMKAVYTFTRVRSEYNGSESYDMDTDDADAADDDSRPYYDLVGQSFTVNVAYDYTLSISGVDEITSKYPDTADIITEDNLLEVAADLFYGIDDTLTVGSTWQLVQSGVTNTYEVSSFSSDNIVVDIIGGDLSVPDSFSTDSGFTYTYSECNSLTGSLLISLSNRMVQEQSSYQDNAGTIEYNGTTYDFTESASSLCNITQAG